MPCTNIAQLKKNVPSIIFPVILSQTEPDNMPQAEKSTAQEYPVRNVQLLTDDCSLKCVLVSQVLQVLKLPDAWKIIFPALLHFFYIVIFHLYQAK